VKRGLGSKLKVGCITVALQIYLNYI